MRTLDLQDPNTLIHPRGWVFYNNLGSGYKNRPRKDFDFLEKKIII
jgi:hypothetical protein